MNEIQDPKTAFCQAVLRKCIVENPQRLAHGLELRADMARRIEAKDQTVRRHYRYQWISRSAEKVIQLLRNIALEFNTLHADDMASQQDMQDIIRTTQRKMSS